MPTEQPPPASARTGQKARTGQDRPGPTPTEQPAMITVRYFAGARAAAGRAQETASAGRSLDELLAELADRHGERLAGVLKVASFLVDGVTCHDRRLPLPAGVTIDVLPPFAGG